MSACLVEFLFWQFAALFVYVQLFMFHLLLKGYFDRNCTGRENILICYADAIFSGKIVCLLPISDIDRFRNESFLLLSLCVLTC